MNLFIPNEHSKKEVWSPIIGYEERYLVSNLGRVKTAVRTKYYPNRGNRSHLVKEKYLTPDITKHGYVRIALCIGYTHKKFQLHRLVASAFIPNPDNKPQVNHINGIKTDNRVENLEWVTALENNQHACYNGLWNTKGENCHLSKLTEKEVIEIYNRTDLNQVQLGKLYNIDRTVVGKIKNGKLWKHAIKKM